MSRAAGREVTLRALQAYYVLVDPEVPVAAKSSILTAASYLLAPIGAVPDLLPGVSYADDRTILASVLGGLVEYVHPEVRAKAKEALRTQLPHA